jgi:Golgi nucleoside diphosphatase
MTLLIAYTFFVWFYSYESGLNKGIDKGMDYAIQNTYSYSLLCSTFDPKLMNCEIYKDVSEHLKTEKEEAKNTILKEEGML